MCPIPPAATDRLRQHGTLRARWAPRDGSQDAEVQCAAVLEDLMVPEVGVEMMTQDTDSVSLTTD